MDELKTQLETFTKQLETLKEKLKISEKRARVKTLEDESQSEGFWTQEERAKTAMQELSGLKEDIEELAKLDIAIEDARMAAELNMVDELTKKVADIKKMMDALDQQTYLSGPHDDADAILSVHSGQGGTEAMDWAEMVLRMYQRYADRKKWKWELVDEQHGEEAGIKSATLVIHGKQAFGYLKHEKGTHRLVRQSPFNADHLRQTSFALVEVMPVVEETSDIVIKPEDLEFEAFRSSGKGGQNVNKVSTAVRIRHKTTGITIECQSQRYQDQNRKIAMQLLRAKLWEIEEKKRQEELRSIKGAHTNASWGTQIRNYVLHPYKLAKDTRTGIESHDPESVLGGDLDMFIDAELRAL